MPTDPNEPRICDRAQPICKKCPHAEPHACSEALEPCVQGNEQNHRTIQVSCVGVSVLNVRKTLEHELIEADHAYDDAVEEAEHDRSRRVQAARQAFVKATGLRP